MFHDTEARHRQLGLELGERAAVTRKKQVEQEATGGVRQCLEHDVVVGHEADDM